MKKYKNLQKDYFRRAAGLKPLEESLNTAKTLNTKSEIYRIFSNFLADLELIKEGLENKHSHVSRFKGEVDKEAMKKMIYENLEMVKNRIDEIFPDSKQSEQDDYEDDYEDDY